ncbi:MAG: LysR family transcriptional regulator [Rhodospirillaceae bacterium]|nr:LysR family transcriptional regulator [Rhodospirillaceae bacterium]
MPLRNLDIDLLRTFALVAEMRSFTGAGRRIHRTQSSVSLQIQRLEELVGRRLCERSPKLVKLTADGEALLECARRILAIHDEYVEGVSRPAVEGKVRFGTPEDFATFRLPEVLAGFSRVFPRVELEVACDLTLNLMNRFRNGEFDVILVKREPSEDVRGTRVWREPLVWVASERLIPRTADQLPLVLSPEPCVYRKRAVQSLRRIKRSWRIAYTSTSLAGTIAAVRAGLGVTILPKGMVPLGLATIDDGKMLPALPDTEIAVLARRPTSRAADRLQDHIIAALENR